MEIFGSDWSSVLASDTPIFELFVRSTALYFFVFVLMRSTLRRSAGELSMLDFIFVLLVTNGAADAMTGGGTSVTSGIVVVATIVGWNYTLNSLSYRIPAVERLLSPQPLQVVRDGELLRRNMRREFLTEQELRGQIREEGIEDLSHVKAAYIEGDGNISVIPYES
jgi:uncharacterized membrane protein YcaP (DUF421 family)